MQPGEEIPQIEPLFCSKSNPQVKNYSDGFVYKVDDFVRLRRFAIMGSEDGKYSFDNQENIVRNNIKCIDELIAAGKGVKVVQVLKDISVKRQNIKQNSLLLALAICARSNNKDSKKAAYAILPEVCRIPTHLFMFIKFCEEESSLNKGTGWGRAHKRAVSQWYTHFVSNPEKLARLVTKYNNREKWTHKDVLRLAHTSCVDKGVGFILRFIVKGYEEAAAKYLQDLHEGDEESKKLKKLDEFIRIYEEATKCKNLQQLCSIIFKYQLPWELCPTKMLKQKDVWKALLPHMPIEATIRNLSRMTALGLFAEKSEEEIVLKKIESINKLVDEKLKEGDEDDDGTVQTRRNYLHPFKILVAWATYKSGHGKNKNLSWEANNKIVQALNDAFYEAFDAVQPTNKKYFLAVDVSGSMAQPVLGSSNVMCSEAAAAMMMLTARTEKNRIIKGFSSEKLITIDVTENDNLDIVLSKTRSISMGETDCALPMKDAMEQKINDIDVFVVYTDNETWYGNVHPQQALLHYRKYAGNNDVKLIVCGMCATEFSIADPEDENMLDVIGFDPSAPRVISDFVSGTITRSEAIGS